MWSPVILWLTFRGAAVSAPCSKAGHVLGQPFISAPRIGALVTIFSVNMSEEEDCGLQKLVYVDPAKGCWKLPWLKNWLCRNRK